MQSRFHVKGFTLDLAFPPSMAEANTGNQIYGVSGSVQKRSNAAKVELYSQLTERWWDRKFKGD